jgi:hypothetical protein
MAHKRLTCGFPAVLAVWLAVSRACDGPDALSDVRPPDRVVGADGVLVGVEGC